MTTNVPIAIVGISYRAPNVGRKGLFEYLAEAKSAWSRVPANRFDQDAFYHPDNQKAGCFSSKGGHFLPDDIYTFDAAFFGLRTEETRAMDPHHRIILECAWEAAENAGMTFQDLVGSNTGVFSAMGVPEHGQQVTTDLASSSAWSCAGDGLCMHANRVSYFFDLGGPSITLDAACASGAVAAHIACQSLRSGECKAAFVNAAHLILGPNEWILLDTMGALSPEGRSFSYDTKASGFGRGEGAVCLLMKRLDDAIADGDTIHSIIRNTASNHSGRSEGITMPSRAAQERLLLQVHHEIGLDPSDTPVVEGHGTGTPVGDPIEAGAFSTVLAKQRTPSDPLYIGSVKSNFGHLEGASGVMGMLKAILMLQQDCILPNAGFEELNKQIEGGDRLRVAQVMEPWPAGAAKRVCVTSFGFGGSNVAIILEKPESSSFEPSSPSVDRDYHKANGSELANGTQQSNGGNHASNGAQPVNGNVSCVHAGVDNQSRLFVVSAKSEASLASYLDSFEEYLRSRAEHKAFLRDLSYTLGQRRSHHPHRVAVAAASVETLRSQLQLAKITKAKERALTFVFTGQGAQYAQMAAGLRHYDIFATAINEADACLRHMGASWSLIEELDKPKPDSRISDAEVSQPACTAIQIAIVRLLKTWGILPNTVTGHSSGEIAAAFAAGVVSFRSAMAIAYFRGQAAASLALDTKQKGSMLALGASFERASKLLNELDLSADSYATVAAINSPQSVTISGDESTVGEVQRLADSEGIFARTLKVQVAYHSRYMEQVAASYLASIKPFCAPDSALPMKGTSDIRSPVFVSSVTGQIAEPTILDASYWVKNLVQPVRFQDAIATIYSLEADDSAEKKRSGKVAEVVLEIGPHSALKTPIQQTIEWARRKTREEQLPQSRVRYLPCLVRGQLDDDTLLSTAGVLFGAGFPIQLEAINQTTKQNSRLLSDLPSYSWDKSVRYALKSWVIQQSLLPGQPYDPLIGWRTSQSVGSDHVFHQVFTLDEMPWIRDHNLGSHAVFPMTGFLSMVVEAVRRVSSFLPATILIQECRLKSSLLIEEDERVSLVTKLTPALTGTTTHSLTAWAFEILSWTEKVGWTTHCHGQAKPETTEMTMASAEFAPLVPLIESSDVKELSVEDEYRTQEKNGMVFGPLFRSMKRLVQGKYWTVIETEMRDLDYSIPSRFGSRVSVDPPTLDSFIHGAGPLATENSGKRVAWMPIHITRLRISNKVPDGAGQRFTSVSRLQSLDPTAGALQFSTIAFARASDGSLIPAVEYESMSYRPTASSSSSPLDSAGGLPWSLQWDTIPDLELASTEEEVIHSLELQTLGKNGLEGRRSRLNNAAVYYMDKALKETATHDFSGLPTHFAKFMEWSRHAVSSHGQVISDFEASSLLHEVSNADAQGKMLCDVGQHLVSFLRDEAEPLEIMLKDGLLTRHYESDQDNLRTSEVLAKLTRHMSNIKPDMRILEIGGGTGSATLPVLQELSSQGGSTFLDYTFTDISSGFFENARNKLSDWAQRITYKRLDISQDPTKQGFATETYDLVIASNVLHATSNIGVTMDHVRSLLKPYGKLILLEVVETLPLALPFVLLPGWWLSEDEYRSCEQGPLLSEATWNRVLSEHGFSGVDIRIPDSQGTSNQTLLSVMSSTRVGRTEEDRREADSVTISGLLSNAQEAEFAELVAEQVSQRLGCASAVKPFAELDPVDDPHCIVIDSPSQSILSDLTLESFTALKTILLEAKSIFWVVSEGCSPEAETIKGILRTLRLEDESRCLLLFERAPSTSQGASKIAAIAKRIRDRDSAAVPDKDFVWHEGMVCLPRLRQETQAKDVFASEAGLPVRRLQNLWTGNNDAFEMTMDVAGNLESVYFRRRTDFLAENIGADEVLIKIEAAGVNFRDLLVVLNSVPGVGLGGEAAGTVTKIGSSVQDLHVGDRVFFAAVGGGSYATHFKLESWRAMKIPDSVTMVDAASMPVAYLTAIVALFRVARLTRGERVLVHAGSGAVGQACIVLAQHLGAQVFSTAGTPTKRQFLHENFGIPNSQIFSSRNSEFRRGILGATDGQGVDVVVNCLSGSLLQDTWDLVAEFGRFVEIGKKDFLENSHLGMRPFNRNVTFSGVDASTLFGQRPEQLRKCLADLTDLLDRGVIVPICPVTVLPISEFGSGLRKLQTGQNIGKLVVTLGKDECVLADCASALKSPPNGLLAPDATYIITGGTGGIGLSLASWMVENGARNVVLLGRSGSSRPEVKRLLGRYTGSGIQMRAIACDVGLRSHLIDALRQIEDLPPVRGVIHGALFLRDALFANSSYQDWQNVTTPRVQGARYLDELLPELDFFVMLSSFLGATGNIGQTIYAGTATFFDAFADYRIANGRKAVSIALPVILDVGFVVDRNLTETLTSSLGVVLSEANVKTVVKGAIIGPASGLNKDGKAISFSYGTGDDKRAPQWKYLHPQAFMKYINSKDRNAGPDELAQGAGGDKSTELRHASDVTLLDALITRVASITMMERDDVEADVSLTAYSLDSLISLELRNWIRRETGVDMSLPKIVGSENLRALAMNILAQREASAGSR